MKRVILTLVLCAAPIWAVAAAAPWRLTVSASEATLTDGAPDSDDVATTLTCKRGERVVHVFAILDQRVSGHGEPPWPVRMGVASGAVQTSVIAAATPDEENGGTDLDAKVPSSDPVIAAFGRTGAIRLSSGGETVKTSPVPAAKAAALLKVCG
ncbi:MAG: hypothetical protein ACHP7N_10295 [Caulobacterales bacterium]